MNTDPMLRNALSCAFLVLLLGSLSAAAATVVASASSGEGALAPEYAVDGNRGTRWSSDHSDSHWLEIDYGESKELVGAILHWETAYAYAYEVQVSSDGEKWQSVFKTITGDGAQDDIDFDKVSARFLKLICNRRGTAWGYSLFEVIPKTAEEPWGEGEPDGFFLRDVWNFMIDEIDFDLEGGGPCPTGERRPIRTHASWETQGDKDYQGATWYQGSFYIPADWEKARPIIQLTDLRDEYELYVNGREVKAGDDLYRSRVQLPLAEYLEFDAKNDVCLKVTSSKPGGGVRGSIALAASPEALFLGLQKLRKKDRKRYCHALAHMEMEGMYPYYFSDRQGYWTVVGLDGDDKESLFCQDGTLEPYKSFSIMPFLYLDNKKRIVTHDDVPLIQSLKKSCLPLPSVVWKGRDVLLVVNAFAAGEPGAAVTYVTYRVKNVSRERQTGQLQLALRPFEVNPPWQWGGVNAIHDVNYESGRIRVNEYQIVPLVEPTRFGVASSRDGDIVRWLQHGRMPNKRSVNDPDGLSSAALEYAFDLEPGADQYVALAIPLYPDTPVAAADTESAAEAEELLRQTMKAVASDWEERLGKTKIRLPNADMAKTLKANLAYILLNRDGPALQPGSRAYEAAWMRDGAMSAAALLRLGYFDEVREFIDWYSTHLYEDGRVPAIVIRSRSEINPVHEYDSQGEFVYTIMQYYRFTRDKAFLEEKWPLVVKALKYLERLRDQEVRDELKERPDDLRYYGVLPKCVSHEGYYPEPGNHSYWDNFWALRGWKDAREMAEELGKTNATAWIDREEAELRKALYESIRVTMKHYDIDYIPGCAELGDFDPTSTAIAIAVCEELEHLPEDDLHSTFYRYIDGWPERLSEGWTGSFSPYEVRIVQALLYMGWKDAALDVLERLMAYRHPRGWRQWPEAVYVPPDHGGYIGDMPHSWISSGYINSIRALLLYEREKDQALVLAAGVPERWVDYRRTVGISDAPTYWGRVTYDLEQVDNTIRVRVSGDAKPPGGIVLKSPLADPILLVTMNGQPCENFTEDEVHISELPAEVIVLY